MVVPQTYPSSDFRDMLDTESLAMTGQMLSVIPISVLVSSKADVMLVIPNHFPGSLDVVFHRHSVCL